MPKLTSSAIRLFSNLQNINDGFRIPDKACVLGKDFKCFEQLGGSLYFSNYWYGSTKDATAWAQSLIDYFQDLYKHHEFEEGDMDFFGMIVLWNIGDYAIVGSIVLDDMYMMGEDVPDELSDAFKKLSLTKVLNDLNDNTIHGLRDELERLNFSSHDVETIFANVASSTSLNSSMSLDA